MMRYTSIRRTAALVSVATIALLATPGLQAAAGSDPNNRGGGSRPRAGHRDDQGICADGGAEAYLWGWALVNNANRHAAFSKAPEPGLMGGVVPIAHNAVAMLTNYVSPSQRFIACANQDVVYGAGFLDNLDKEPIVFQVPDFGDRFWVYALYDARTDQLSNIGKQYGTKPGFYMVVGPNWKGETPKGITAVLRSSTTVVFAISTRFHGRHARRITPPSNRCSVRSTSTRSRTSTGK